MRYRPKREFLKKPILTKCKKCEKNFQGWHPMDTCFDCIAREYGEEEEDEM